MAAEARKLVKACGAFDRARARLAGLPSTSEAKQQFDEATRRAQLNPSAENLHQVAEATRTLQKGSPRRTKAENDHASARRTVEVLLSEILKAARA